MGAEFGVEVGYASAVRVRIEGYGEAFNLPRSTNAGGETGGVGEGFHPVTGVGGAEEFRVENAEAGCVEVGGARVQPRRNYKRD